MSWYFNHFREQEADNVDPDDGISWSCSVCNLPIFSTPYIKSNTVAHSENNNNVIYMHDQCANLPEELAGSPVHPGFPLVLREKPPGTTRLCSNCRWVKCGSKFYVCRADHACLYSFDVLCALTTSVRVLHRSHEHRLTAVRGAGLTSALVCGACGTQHPEDGGRPRWASRLAVSYLCHACGFWIHPRCASLPNTIELQQHQHPLVLKYYLSEDSFVRRHQDERYEGAGICVICRNMIKGVGVYACIKCRDYRVDIMCAYSLSFRPVLTREAQLPDLIRLPVPDENTSMVRYIIDNTSSSNLYEDNQLLHLQYLHEHPLILHDQYDDKDDDKDDEDDDQLRICNACVHFISPPFYKCSECPDFLLHNHCAHLPPTLTQQPAHDQDLSLTLYTKHGGISYKSMLVDRSRYFDYPTNGFIYSGKNQGHFDLDVLSAIMPATITHDAHSRTHILYPSFTKHEITTKRCQCCCLFVDGLYYECWTCHNFRLHYSCALLPNTVRHKFDPHPLKMTTNTSESSSPQLQELLCEICEEGIFYRFWHYSCEECDQAFHIHCIPRLDALSKIKFGVTNVRVRGHGCPLSLVRASKVCGYRCGHCRNTINNDSKIAYECRRCYFWTHDDCADKMLEYVD